MRSPRKRIVRRAAMMRFCLGFQSARSGKVMKPTVMLAKAATPDGGEMVLYRHGMDFSIKVNGRDLMNSRQHESELDLARLGCAHLTGRKAPSVLVGGLGLGYTLRQALEMLGPGAEVVVGELMGAVIEWNRGYLAELNGRLLDDERVVVEVGDVAALISRSAGRFDAILLDVDNGPNEMTHAGNRRLYGREGIGACRRALREGGCLAAWSAEPSTKFEQLLTGCGLQVRRFRVRAHKGSKSQSRFVWVAAEDERLLPRA